MPPGKILQGPKVAAWICPSCREAVPRLLPNGERNRVRLDPKSMYLPGPEVEAAMSRVQGLRATEVCFACADTYRELLGTLIRPPWEDGDPRSSPGLSDTGIIGALLPIAGRGTQVLIFHAVQGVLRNTESEELRRLNPDRLTYPGSRGAIAPCVWSMYEAHLADLHAAMPPEP